MTKDSGAEAGSEAKGARTARWWLMWALRIGGTAGGFAYIAHIVTLDDLLGAFGRVGWLAFLGAGVVTGLNLVVGAARWRVLLAAYGAPKRPPLARLAKVYLVGFFYNNFYPGGLGGDVVRAIVTRESFGERGTAASLTVVFVERVLGLSGLLLLVSVTYVIRPIPGTEGVLPWSAAGLSLAAGGVISLALGRRIAPFFPKKIGTILASLPVIERAAPFAIALGMSLVTQALVAVTGWLLMASVSQVPVTFMDALVLVPLAMAAAFFPLSVGGAGVREVAFIGLAGAALSMSEADATAVSLLIWFTQLSIGALGGIVQLVAPVRSEAAE